MNNNLKNALRAPYRKLRAHLLDTREWSQRAYAAPSPKSVKDEVLLRNGLPNATWVETGTFLGETTSLLAANALKVFSVEPEATLFSRAVKKFSDQPHVKIVNGPSESVFPSLLPTLSGDVNFWLDGHYSAGVTFKGDLETPIIEELAQIEANLGRFNGLSVLVDDVRCFDPGNPEYSTYPPIDFLVDWARRNKLGWHIEHDIFVARRAPQAA